MRCPQSSCLGCVPARNLWFVFISVCLASTVIDSVVWACLSGCAGWNFGTILMECTVAAQAIAIFTLELWFLCPGKAGICAADKLASQVRRCVNQVLRSDSADTLYEPSVVTAPQRRPAGCRFLGQGLMLLVCLGAYVTQLFSPTRDAEIVERMQECSAWYETYWALSHYGVSLIELLGRTMVLVYRLTALAELAEAPKYLATQLELSSKLALAEWYASPVHAEVELLRAARRPYEGDRVGMVVKAPLQSLDSDRLSQLFAGAHVTAVGSAYELAQAASAAYGWFLVAAVYPAMLAVVAAALSVYLHEFSTPSTDALIIGTTEIFAMPSMIDSLVLTYVAAQFGTQQKHLQRVLADLERCSSLPATKPDYECIVAKPDGKQRALLLKDEAKLRREDLEHGTWQLRVSILDLGWSNSMVYGSALGNVISVFIKFMAK